MDEGTLLTMLRKVLREELDPPGAMVLSYEKAAKALDVSERTIRRMVRTGDLLTVQIGSTPKIPRSELTRASSLPEFGQRPVDRQKRIALGAAGKARRAKEEREKRLSRAPAFDTEAAERRLDELLGKKPKRR